MSPQNNRGPSSLPAPVGGSLDESSITVEEVEGSGVGKLRDDEGMLKTSGFSMNVVLRGLRVGGVNVIIVGVAGAMKQRLKVSRERYRMGKVNVEGGKGERSEEKKRKRGVTYKASHQQWGNPEP